MVPRLEGTLWGGVWTLVVSLVLVLSLGLPPAIARGELTIKKIEINQAIGKQYKDHLNFVAGKNTVLRAFLSESVTFSKRLRLLGLENTSATATNTTTEKSFELKPKSYDAATDVVDFYCAKVSECDNWAAGDYEFSITVKGVTRKTTEKYEFKERKPLRMLAVPVKANYGGEVVPYPSDNYKTLWQYTRDVYPVADDGLKWKLRSVYDASTDDFDLNTDKGQDKLLVALNNMNPRGCDTTSGDGCSDIIVGIVAKKPDGSAGYTRGKPSVVVTGTDLDAGATVSHETAHCFDIGDTYEGGHINCKLNPAPDGWVGKDWYTLKKTACYAGTEPYGETAAKIPLSAHAFDVNKRGNLGIMADFMGSSGKYSTFWITPDVYDHLFNSFAPSPASSPVWDASPQRLIAYGGFITAADHAITLDPWESYTAAVDIPDSSGTFTIKALAADGRELATQGIEVSFWVKSDPPRKVESAPFRGVMRFPEDTARFVIVRAGSGTVLKEINVSANPPVVDGVSPTTPGVVIAGEYTITWTGQDADGSELFYKVEYNPDTSNAESEWMVLAADLKATAWTENFDRLPGGSNAMIRVAASDGILTASAQSALFTVAGKPPQVFIADLEWGSAYEYGATILLVGEAYDLNDGWLGDEKLEWKSDLSGILGYGSPLLVDSLPPGVHTLTLSGTNSKGLQSNAQTTLTVSECTYAVTPQTVTFKADGESGEVQVTASQAEGTSAVCTLTDEDLATVADDDSVWLEAKVTSFENNQGVVLISAQPNDSKFARRGVVGILGNEVAVTQKGAPCSLRLGKVAQVFQQEGGTGTIQVDVIDGCDLKWSASQDRTWLTITSGQSGKGDGTVTFSVASNPRKVRRFGHISINSQIFTVIQDPGSSQPVGEPAPVR